MADVDVQQSNNGDSGTNWLLVIVVLVLVLLIAWFLFQGGAEQPADIEVEVPQADAPSIEVPEQVDVNIRDGDGQ